MQLGHMDVEISKQKSPANKQPVHVSNCLSRFGDIPAEEQTLICDSILRYEVTDSSNHSELSSSETWKDDGKFHTITVHVGSNDTWYIKIVKSFCEFAKTMSYSIILWTLSSLTSSDMLASCSP